MNGSEHTYRVIYIYISYIYSFPSARQANLLEIRINTLNCIRDLSFVSSPTHFDPFVIHAEAVVDPDDILKP